ncbi:MAG: enoyl-CoA hydratase-related protein [Saprospiraceae bacterium]|nr:enoyl-CoA hydratase-related protein [Saprospiraceae bacterium]
MDQNYQTLLLEDFNNICLLTINRPATLNALNSQVFSELHHFFQVLAPGKPELKGIIIKGAGDKAFVAGADITEFKGISPGQAKEFLKKGNEVMNLIMSFPKIVVAAVGGFALGGGCELAMACHLRIASEKARFGLPEVNLGILPGYGGTQRLPQLVGKAKALEWMMTGDLISAEDALRFGLVNQLTKPGEELTVALEWVNRISTKAPLSIARIIEAVNSYYPNLENGIEREGELFNDLAQTEDFKEGVDAFLEKRKAVFHGR